MIYDTHVHGGRVEMGSRGAGGGMVVVMVVNLSPACVIKTHLLNPCD